MRLNANIIVQAGLRILNQEGLEAVTTRRLGRELGVEGPALYRHFRNKQELLGLMTAAMLSEVLEGMVQGTDWQDWLRQFGERYRAALLRYRDGAQMLATSAPSERTQREIVPGVYRPLLDAGFSLEQALQAEGFVASLVLGWVIQEQNPVIRALLEEAGPSSDAIFSIHLEIAIGGLGHWASNSGLL